MTLFKPGLSIKFIRDMTSALVIEGVGEVVSYLSNLSVFGVGFTTKVVVVVVPILELLYN